MKNLFLSLSLIGAAALVGCSKTETPAPAAPAEPAAAAAPAAPASQWPELRVAIDPTYKPFTYKTPDGKPTGFDVKIAQALCDKIKTKCVFVEQQWDAMIPGLMAKKYDTIISSMSVTEERLRQVAFTGKYYNTPSKVVVHKDIKTLYVLIVLFTQQLAMSRYFGRVVKQSRTMFTYKFLSAIPQHAFSAGIKQPDDSTRLHRNECNFCRRINNGL